MTLTSQEASKLRFKILSDIDADGYVEIDHRFVKPIFGSEQAMTQWACRWDLQVEQFSHSDMRRHRTPIKWISFTKPAPSTLILLFDDQL
jgi:hypothetical protein